MRSANLALIALGALPCLAFAQVDPNLISSGYDPRDLVQRGVVPNDTATMSLYMSDSSNHSASVNLAGETEVTRGTTFADLGANRNGGGHLLGAWEEVIQGNALFVNAVFKTSDGSEFMPPTSQVSGHAAYFWSWHLGVNDPVNFQSFVTSVPLIQGRVAFSGDGGQSFSSSYAITSNLSPDWDPGRDPGLLIPSIGDGTNYMLLQYEIHVVPAPAALGSLGAGVMLFGLRRKR